MVYPQCSRFMLALIPALLLIACSRSLAATTFVANLTNGQENPPAVPTLTNGDPRPASFGDATFHLADGNTSLTMSVTVTNIDFTGSQTADTNDNLTNAHIHGGVTVTPTTNGGVVWGFHGAPFNDNNPNDIVFTPFATGVGGTITGKWDAIEGNNTTLTAQLTNLFLGRTYINFHTSQFGGGEVRGAILIPEPSAVALLGASAILALKRRRR